MILNVDPNETILLLEEETTPETHSRYWRNYGRHYAATSSKGAR